MENEDVIDYNKPVSEYRYAGFWVRVGAYFLDVLILIVPISLLQTAIFETSYANPNPMENIVGLIVWWLYHGVLESSNLKATFGKHALDLKVIDENGEQLTFSRASGRYWAMFISSILLFYGFIQIGFDKRKQGLHDKIAKCLVVYK